MPRRISRIRVRERIVEVLSTGPTRCVTVDENCCTTGSGSGSGSGSYECVSSECVLSCSRCSAGTSSVWEVLVTGYEEPITVCYVIDAERSCLWVSADGVWELSHVEGDEVWTLYNLETGEFFYLREDLWDCSGENVMLNFEDGGDSAVVTPVYSCDVVSYNCVDGTCVVVAGSGGAHATLVECEAACGNYCAEAEALSNGTPATVVISDKTGACTCVADTTLNKSGLAWAGTVGSGCTNPSAWSLRCVSGAWSLDATNIGLGLVPDSVSNVGGSLVLVFNNLPGSGVCSPPTAGTFTATVTIPL